MIEHPFPVGARMIYLEPNSKKPDTSRHEHAWQSHIPMPEVLEENYGIILANQYLVVDIDKEHMAPPDFMAFLNNCNTLTVKTQRGYHFYFLPDERQPTKTTLVSDEGNPFGDLLGVGYVVGPGSTIDGKTYTVINKAAPKPVPPRVLNYFEKTSRKDAFLPENSVGIPPQYHDQFASKMAGWLRGTVGLDLPHIRKALEFTKDNLLTGVDPSYPFTDRDVDRWVKSASTYKAENRLDSSGFVRAGFSHSVDFEFEDFDWYIHGFVPRGGYLVTGYADGGTGKSSFGHYLAKLVTQRGDSFLVLNHEDPPKIWKACAVMAGANRDLLYAHENSLSFITPRDMGVLRDFVKEKNIKFIWFDSVKDHFDTTQKMNEAQLTRASLSPLAEMAANDNVTIMGIFHTNKTGGFAGSTEMRNVARHVLKFDRDKRMNAPIVVTVDKTNLFKPEYDLEVYAERKPIADPEDPTNEAKMYFERMEDGTRKPRMVYSIISTGKRLRQEEPAEDEDKPTQREYDLVDGYEASGLSQNQYAKKVGTSQPNVSKAIKRVADWKKKSNGEFMSLDHV